MGLLARIVVGLVAGWLDRQVMRAGGDGLIGDVSRGAVGAVIGGFLAGAFLNMPDAANGINVTSILVDFVGAVMLIAVLPMFSGRRLLTI